MRRLWFLIPVLLLVGCVNEVMDGDTHTFAYMPGVANFLFFLAGGIVLLAAAGYVLTELGWRGYLFWFVIGGCLGGCAWVLVDVAGNFSNERFEVSVDGFRYFKSKTGPPDLTVNFADVTRILATHRTFTYHRRMAHSYEVPTLLFMGQGRILAELRLHNPLPERAAQRIIQFAQERQIAYDATSVEAKPGF